MKKISNNHWLYTIPVAHRGLHSCSSKIPENSMAAFKNAINKNFAIELDVQLSRDNEIVVFHDYDLKRVCNVDNQLNNFTLAELKTLKLFDSNETIPSLIEVLNLINNQVPILIEIKNESTSTILEEKLNNVLIEYNGRFAVQSFNPKSIKWFYKNNENIIRGILASNFKDVKINFIVKYLLKNLFFNFMSKPNFIAFNIEDLPKNKILKLRKKMPIIGWTINSNNKLLKAKKYCDNIIFECLNSNNLNFNQ